VVNVMITTSIEALIEQARAIAATVTDPEMPMLTLIDLGVLRSVDRDPDGTVVVTITPTYSGCPAMPTMRDDLLGALAAAGFGNVDVRTVLTPAWTTNWITDDGRRKLAESGIAAPAIAAIHRHGPVPLTLTPRRLVVACPLCGSTDTEQTSEFGSTACKSLHRCRSCAEPFDRVKEI
jgi:ring-1,2-phenylacetyl-CoA epoxidase subunit PaaD